MDIRIARLEFGPARNTAIVVTFQHLMAYGLPMRPVYQLHSTRIAPIDESLVTRLGRERLHGPSAASVNRLSAAITDRDNTTTKTLNSSTNWLQ